MSKLLLWKQQLQNERKQHISLSSIPIGDLLIIIIIILAQNLVVIRRKCSLICLTNYLTIITAAIIAKIFI